MKAGSGLCFTPCVSLSDSRTRTRGAEGSGAPPGLPSGAWHSARQSSTPATLQVLSNRRCFWESGAATQTGPSPLSLSGRVLPRKARTCSEPCCCFRNLELMLGLCWGVSGGVTEITQTHTHLHTDTYTHSPTHTPLYKDTYMHTYTYTQTPAHTYTPIQRHQHAHISLYTHIYTHTPIHRQLHT